MPEKVNIPTDPISILALVFGAAVVVPSLIVLLINLVALGDRLL